MASKISDAAALALVGDSDIRRWPERLWPRPLGVEGCLVSGRDGATLADVLPLLREVLAAPVVRRRRRMVLVICAGENDIGENTDAREIVESFQMLLDLIFGPENPHPAARIRLIFLGPKIEPWLEEDKQSRNQYIRLARRLQEACQLHPHASYATFIDCLTMFCDETTLTRPGALFGGQASADPRYFDPDRLHLSDTGYERWKLRVEEAIEKILLEP